MAMLRVDIGFTDVPILWQLLNTGTPSELRSIYEHMLRALRPSLGSVIPI